MWNVLECGGSGREKRGKKETNNNKKREGHVCGGEKKWGKKREKEIWMKKREERNKGKIK